MNESTTVSPEQDETLLREFSVASESAIKRLLCTIKEDEHEIYMYTNNGEQHFVTEIIGLDWDNNCAWLGTPYDKKLCSGVNQHTSFVVVSFPDGVKIQIAGIGVLRTDYDGAEALRISIPKSIVRLQRRNYFRVMADELLKQQIRLIIPSLTKTFELLDISLAGCGLDIPGTLEDFQIGQRFSNVSLILPDTSERIRISLEICNLKNNSDSPGHMTLGCEIQLLQRSDERRLQRYLLSTERRQRANYNSM